MRYFLTFLIIIGLIVLVFILILKGFSNKSTPPSKNAPKPLISYASTNAVASLTIGGPVVYDQKYQSVQIDVNQFQTQLNTIQGYQGTVTGTYVFPNNQAAYAVFLRAIDLQGFTKGDTTGSSNDSRGVCPFGLTYNYELTNNGQTIEHYWASSCGKVGTFKGNRTSINSLFQAQIPNYDSLTAKLNL